MYSQNQNGLVFFFSTRLYKRILIIFVRLSPVYFLTIIIDQFYAAFTCNEVPRRLPVRDFLKGFFLTPAVRQLHVRTANPCLLNYTYFTLFYDGPHSPGPHRRVRTLFGSVHSPPPPPHRWVRKLAYDVHFSPRCICSR